MTLPVRTTLRMLGVAACLVALPAFAQYDPAACAQVTGTLNIHWRALTGSTAGCTGIEFTNGSFAQARMGSVVMQGVGVSNAACIGTDSYAFTVNQDQTALNGGTPSVPMALFRSPGQDCFVGHWISGSTDYLAHIAAAPFVAHPVPGLDAGGLAALSAALAAVAAFAGRRRKRALR